MHVKHTCAVSAPYMLVPLEILSPPCKGPGAGRWIPFRCLSFFLGPRRRGREAGPPPRGSTRRPGCSEQRWARLGAGGGAGRGAGGGPGGVTWRAAAAEGEVAAPALEGVRGRECPEPGRRAAARGTPEPGPAAGARPGEWPGLAGPPRGRAPGGRAPGKPRPGRGSCAGRSWRGQGWGAPPEPPLAVPSVRAGTATSSPRTGATLSVDAPGQPGFEWEPEEAARLAVGGSRQRLSSRLRWPWGSRVESGVSPGHLCAQGLWTPGAGRPLALPRTTQVVAGGWVASDTKEGAALCPERLEGFRGIQGSLSAPQRCAQLCLCDCAFSWLCCGIAEGWLPHSGRI